MEDPVEHGRDGIAGTAARCARPYQPAYHNVPDGTQEACLSTPRGTDANAVMGGNSVLFAEPVGPGEHDVLGT